jgi:hypothetical protein
VLRETAPQPLWADIDCHASRRNGPASRIVMAVKTAIHDKVRQVQHER